MLLEEFLDFSVSGLLPSKTSDFRDSLLPFIRHLGIERFIFGPGPFRGENVRGISPEGGS